MNTITPKLAELLEQETTTFATCWLLKLKSGEELGFTDFDQDLNINNITYHSASGFTGSAIQSNSGLAVDNLEIEGMLDNELILKQDLIAGKYDHAEIEIFLVNYENLSAGKLHLKRGWFGEVSIKDNMFIAEVKGLTHALNKNIGDLYSHRCRAKFGDEKCKVDLSKYTFSGTITEVQSNNIITDINRAEESNFFQYGSIKFLTGANQGIAKEVQSYTKNGKIVLASQLPHKPSAGDSYEIITGCNKSFEICYKQFNNAINFRGEPHIPGISKLLKV